MWFAAGALFLLGTGMPWTKVGGAWIKTLSAAIGQGSPRESNAGAHRSELTGWSPPLQAGLAQKIDTLASAPIDEHAEHRTAAAAKTEPPKSTQPRISLDRVIALAAEHRVPAPYAIALPVGPSGVLSAITDRNLAFQRAFLHLDQYSGKVLADVRYADYGIVGKFFLWGIIAHEGQLFGLLNQLLGTLAAFGVFALSASGLFLWWQRRPAGRLAAPVATVPLPRPVFLGTLALAAFLPLLAATLTLLLIVDRFMGRRLPALNPT